MLLLQTVATAVANAVPVTNPDISNLVDAVSDQFGLVAVSVWVIQFMKRSTMFPGISANTPQITRLVATGMALASALAVQIHVQGNAEHGWHGTFDIRNAHALWTSFIRFCGAKMGQDGLYNLVYDKPVEVTPVPPEPMNTNGKPLTK